MAEAESQLPLSMQAQVDLSMSAGSYKLSLHPRCIASVEWLQVMFALETSTSLLVVPWLYVAYLPAPDS